MEKKRENAKLQRDNSGDAHSRGAADRGWTQLRSYRFHEKRAPRSFLSESQTRRDFPFTLGPISRLFVFLPSLLLFLCLHHSFSSSGSRAFFRAFMCQNYRSIHWRQLITTFYLKWHNRNYKLWHKWHSFGIRHYTASYDIIRHNTQQTFLLRDIYLKYVHVKSFLSKKVFLLKFWSMDSNSLYTDFPSRSKFVSVGTLK